MTVVHTDAFTVASDQELSAYDADYLNIHGGSNLVVDAGNDRVECTTENTDEAYIWQGTGSPTGDGEVRAQIKCEDNDGSVVGLVVRGATGSDYYVGNWNDFQDALRISRVNGGSFTTLNDVAFTPPADGIMDLRFRVTGTNPVSLTLEETNSGTTNTVNDSDAARHTSGEMGVFIFVNQGRSAQVQGGGDEVWIDTLEIDDLQAAITSSHPAHYEHLEPAAATTVAPYEHLSSAVAVSRTVPAPYEHLLRGQASQPVRYEHLQPVSASTAAPYERLQTAARQRPASYEHLASSLASSPAAYEHLVTALRAGTVYYEHLGSASSVSRTRPAHYEHLGRALKAGVAAYEHLQQAAATDAVLYEHLQAVERAVAAYYEHEGPAAEPGAALHQATTALVFLHEGTTALENVHEGSTTWPT